MTEFLLDVNVLVALAWPTHEAHSTVQRWFSSNASRGWATCPLTQTAFVRILSNPAFSSDALTPLEAAGVLGITLRHPSHQFWPDSLGAVQALERFGQRVVGHQQIADAYLLALALHHKGTLATLDRSVPALLGRNGAAKAGVEVIE